MNSLFFIAYCCMSLLWDFSSCTLSGSEVTFLKSLEINVSPSLKIIIASSGIFIILVTFCILFLTIAINRKTKELEIEKNKAQESDRLKSVFLANMSHDIRTPLNAIVGFSSLLCESDDKSKNLEYQDIIRDNSELLLQLINDILDISKIQSNTLTLSYGYADIDKILRDLEVSSTLKLDGKKNIVISFEGPYKHLILNTDSHRFLQVMINFITNAIKFTDQGYIKFGYTQYPSYVYFYVSDTGIGIAPEKLNTVFQRFVKLNDYRTGSGLGLAISEMIVKLFGGEIGVKSIVGEGSTFWFTLPTVSKAK